MIVKTSSPKTDPRDRPAYLVSEAAGYVGVPASTVRAWSRGQNRRVQGEVRRFQPIIRPASIDPTTLSFWNLVELYVLASIRRHHGVSMQKVRRALRYVEQRLDVSRPLLRQAFLTDGVDLFVEKYSQLISASEEGQIVIRATLEGSLLRIQRDDAGVASKLYPWILALDEPHSVEIDPDVAFGRLTLAGTGIPTSEIGSRFRAGDSIRHLMKDYGLTTDQVEAALRWEQHGAAA